MSDETIGDLLDRIEMLATDVDMPEPKRRKGIVRAVHKLRTLLGEDEG